jgi:hypothetical protein
LEKGAYSVLVDDIDDDDELAVVLAVVDEGDPSDLHVPLERLQITEKANQIQISEDEIKERRRVGARSRCRERLTILGS